MTRLIFYISYSASLFASTQNIYNQTKNVGHSLANIGCVNSSVFKGLCCPRAPHLVADA